ncbi:MAG: DUF881 domain-containing protein [Sarcina sp.]
MKNKEINIFMFIAAIIFGVLISINIGVVNEEKKGMSMQAYQDAYEKRTRLRAEIDGLEKKGKDVQKKIDKYEKNDEANDSKSDVLKDELLRNKNLLGITEVEGEGVIIKLEDGKGLEGEVADGFIEKQRTIHDNDINELLNDIKLAKAEAISINDKRIIYNTSVYCAAQFLKIDNINVPAPFYIKIIGDKEMLNANLMSEEKTLKKLMNRGIKVEIQIYDKIKIPPYTGGFNYSKK